MSESEELLEMAEKELATAREMKQKDIEEAKDSLFEAHQNCSQSTLIHSRISSGSISPELLNVMLEDGKKLENEKEVAESLRERSRED